MATSTLRIGKASRKKEDSLIPEILSKYRDEVKSLSSRMVDRSEKINELQKEIDGFSARKELIMETINKLQGVK